MASSVPTNISDETFDFAGGLVIGNQSKRIQDAIESLSSVKDELWRLTLGLKGPIVGKFGSDNSEMLNVFQGQERNDKKDIFNSFTGRRRERVREALECLNTFITNVTSTLSQFDFVFPDINRAMNDQCLIFEQLRSRLPDDVSLSDDVETIL